MLGLSPDEVHIWLVPAARADAVARVLDAAERQRADRFRFETDRALYTAAHGALRLLLGRYLAEPPEALTFDATELGKPYLAGGSGLTFNISHSKGLAAVAVALQREVGVDVEHRRPLHAEDGVARRVMTPEELDRYVSLDGKGRRQYLLWVWARKEALVKASGRGVRESLTSLSCAPEVGDRWTIFDVYVPDYAAAVAAEGHDWMPLVRYFHG